MQRLVALLTLAACGACAPSTSPSGGAEAWVEPDTAAHDSGAPADARTTTAPGTWAAVDNAAWRRADAADDPFPDRPDAVDCLPTGFGEEDGAFEVDTELCSYGTFAQPLLVDVPAGTELLAIYWHLELWHDEPATGHVALTISDDVVLDHEVAIPGAPATHRVTWVAPRDLAAGEPVRFHVHNHGYNNWAFGLLQAEVTE